MRTAIIENNKGKIEEYTVMKTKLLNFLFLAIAFFATAAHAFFGSSGPNPNLEKIKVIRQEVLTSTQEIWKSIETETSKLRAVHQQIDQFTPEKVNALSLKLIMNEMEKRQVWAQKFDELADFLKHEYNQIPQKVSSATDMAPVFRDMVLNHYESEFVETAKKTGYIYLTKAKTINNLIYDFYKKLAETRFPKELGSSAAPENISLENLNAFKGALTLEMWENANGDKKEFDEFVSHFHFNPAEDSVYYQAATQLYMRNPELQKQLQDSFIASFFSDGLLKAETDLKYKIIPVMNTELPTALPKASGQALEKFARESMDVLKGFYSSPSGADTKFCLVFADAREFVGIDYNQILNLYFHKDTPWQIGFFQAVNDVLFSAQTKPETYKSKLGEAENLLRLAKKAAVSSVSENTHYKKLLGKNKYSPRRFCFLRYTLLSELLKLPEPSREDALRMLYTNEATVKPISSPSPKKKK